jgi:hypothetical protein
MAKKQTRRSISVSRTTYERLKSFCETNGISMSQFVENRVGDFLGEGAGLDLGETGIATERPPIRPATPSPGGLRPAPAPPRPASPSIGGSLPPKSATQSSSQSSSSSAGIVPRPSSVTPMTSAAARYAVEPPPPIIKKTDQPAPPAPAMPKANEIFTF